MKHIRVLMVALSLVAVTGVTGCDTVKDIFDPLYCDSDSDCPDDTYCNRSSGDRQGICINMVNCLCATDADCSAGQHCVFASPGDRCGYQCAPDSTDGDTDADIIDTADGDDVDTADITEIDGDTDETVDGTETDGDVDEVVDLEEEADIVERPDPGISGYIVAILHSVNTQDYDGNEISLYQLGEDGQWGAFYQRETFADAVADVTFTPDCTRMLVAQSSGDVTVFSIENGVIASIGTIETEAYISAILATRNDAAWVLDGNGAQWGGGLKVVDLTGDPGTVTSQFIAMHAPSGLAVSPDNLWALAFGGPEMSSTDNTTVCSLDGAQISLGGYYDFWDDQASVASPGFSPDGTRFAAGNNSPYYDDANTMKLFSFSSEGVPAVIGETTVQNPSAAVFSDDGTYLMVSTFDGNSVEVFDVSNDTLTAVSSATGLPLADRIVPIRSGPLAGHVMVGTYNAMVLMKVEANGTLSEVSRQNNGGEGASEIFGYFAIGHTY